jgi:prolipoprotein diacylglyceryltransferase
MPLPVSFHLGPLSIQAHLVFETLAFFTGFRYFLHLRKGQRDPITENNRVWIFIGASLGALIGSRLLGALESPSALLTGETGLLKLFGSKTMVGGLLGGLAGVELMKQRIGETRSSGDLFTFPLMLGIIIGRIGCFLNGMAEPVYGLQTNWITGMDLGDGQLRHPVALYEIGFLMLLWFSIWLVEKKFQLQEGLRFKLFMIAYLGFRFLLDFIKPREPLLAGLSSIQLACLAGLAYYRITILKLIFNPRALIRHPQEIQAGGLEQSR